jgi:Fic/DOC family N-terminal
VHTGFYELDPQGRPCFRPAVPRFPALEDILDVLEPATAAIREFDRALSAWERPGLVGRLFARLDAVHSSGAEGSTTTFSELMEYQTSLRRAPDPADAAAVAACAEAIEAEPRDIDPVAATLAIHRRLFAHARDPMVEETAGRLKLRRTAPPIPMHPAASSTSRSLLRSPQRSTTGAPSRWRAIRARPRSSARCCRTACSSTSIPWPTATAASAGSWCR